MFNYFRLQSYTCSLLQYDVKITVFLGKKKKTVKPQPLLGITPGRQKDQRKLNQEVVQRYFLQV